MLSIYTSLPHWNTQCMFDFGKKSMCECYLKAIFCYLHGFEILHRVNLTELTLFFSSAGDFSLSSVFPPCQCDSCSGFGFFSALRNRNVHWLLSFFLSLSLSSLSRLYFANKQSPVDATINRCWVTVRLHGNFVFNWSIWCIWNSGPFNNRCQCQEKLYIR